MNEFENVKLWLRSTYNIGVSDEWLTVCLEWIQEEHQGTLPSMDNLLPQVFQQWLLSDLSEIGEQVLPQNIVSEEKSELVGNYPLQLLSLVDEGFPLYGQKQKLQGRVNPNEEVSADKQFQPAWEPKPSRMLLFQLTDGHTNIEALEYKQIKDLHAELPSGLKILVNGSVLCRRGVLMLTPECVLVLGGEVDTLVEQNTPLAVLEREMMRNREDEGKHAKAEFSGKFLSCGADKMLDNSQKHLKTEGFGRLSVCERMSRPGQQHVKPEPPGFASSSFSHLSLKQETDQADTKMQYFEQEIKQEDDMNYDDCFSDDLDLQEIDALDSASAVCMEVDTPEIKHSNTGFQRSVSGFQRSDSGIHRSDTPHSLPGYCERGQPHNQSWNVAGTSTSSDMKLSTTLNQSVASNFSSNNANQPTNLSNTDNDFEAFDDDFDIDEFSDNVPVSNTNNALGLALPSGVGKNTFNSSSESKFTYNPVAGSQGKSCQQTFQRTTQPVNTAVQPQPLVSSYSMPSKGLQNDPGRKNTLFKVKSSPQKRIENLDTSIKIPAKKQVKLSDMFASNSDKNKPKPTSLNDNCAITDSDQVTHSQHVFDDDCCIVDDGHSAPAPSEKSDMTLSSKSSSKCVNSSSIGKLKSFSSRSPAATDSSMQPHSKVERECRLESALGTLSKAATYPSTNSGLLAVADRSPFQYLSDWTNVQPPASLIVKAYISTLTDKLGTNGGANWSLACRINDGTACMDVDLADSVLAELIGFSAKDSVIMRQKIKSEPHVKDVLMEGLSKCQQQLINMSCLMEVDIVSTVRKPVVRKLIPVSRQHVLELLTRVEKQLSL